MHSGTWERLPVNERQYYPRSCSLRSEELNGGRIPASLHDMSGELGEADLLFLLADCELLYSRSVAREHRQVDAHGNLALALQVDRW